MTSRIPYELLTDAEQNAIHAWCRQHAIVPEYTPVDALIEFDATVGEWRIEQHVRAPGGGVAVDVDAGCIRRRIVRRVHRADLPWRVKATGGVVTGTPYIVGEHGCSA